MKAETKHEHGILIAIVFVVFAAALIVAFLSYRGSDIGQLPKLIGKLGGGPLIGDGIKSSLAGLIVAPLILCAWLGAGRSIYWLLGVDATRTALRLAVLGGLGAAFWSFFWFLAGLSGGFYAAAAIAAVLAGIALFALPLLWRKKPENHEFVFWRELTAFQWSLVTAVGLILAISLASATAPPVAKDTLLYHFTLPKIFVAQHGVEFVAGNIASYLALGSEMHSVWAMLLGNVVSPRAGEAAAGATTFLFLPLLLSAVYGWARELDLSRPWTLLATAGVATIPTAYHVASSGYIDLSLALYVTLAAYGLTRWWKEQSWGWTILVAIFLGAALSIKLTAVFVFAAFALIILLRARAAKNPVAAASGSDGASVVPRPGRVAAMGFAALLLAGVIASPWYIRTWAATGSPIFPFYMSIWPGKADGWDVERSNLFQAMNSQYGGADANKLNYLTAPVRASVMAQPEQPAFYDGVLGPAFLIGLPLLIFALWKLDLAVDVKIMAGVAGIIYLFWLFSSQQLRYLLPIVPLLAIAIAAAAERIGGRLARVAQFSLVAASICGLLTIFAWFCQKAPLRVVLGGETRDEYLTRNLDYYPYYQTIHSDTPADARVWLINMRRDTYHLDRPVFADYLFEDWTLRRMLWESRNVQELRAKTAAMGVDYVLTRHDFLFDYDRSTLVDDKRPRAENEAKLRIARDFILDPVNTIRADAKFSLIKVFTER